MRKKFSLFLAGTLLLLSAFAAACTSQKNETSDTRKTPSSQKTASEQQGEQATGRYREETISFPVPVETVFDMEQTGDNIRVLLEQKPGDFCCCKSSDNGITWQQENWNTQWLPDHYRVVSACFAPEGTFLVSAGKISEDPLEEQHAVGAYTYFKLKETEQGLEAEPLPLEIPEPKEEYLKSGYGLNTITCSEDGKFYGVLQYRSGEENTWQILGFDPDKGTINWKRNTSAAEIQVYGNTLYLNEYNGALKTLDTASGADLTETDRPPGILFISHMDMNPEKEDIFYCNETGIYSSDHTMTLTELLVDGNLSSFSDITCDIRYFFHINENVFLIFLQNNSSKDLKLLRYEYDAQLATQPEQELTVYSLNSDDVIKKLISDFQSCHPDVYITYQTGMEDSGAKEESDVINILNTEIMAGKGPDILFLNGLPWKSYLEQGILSDLSSSLKSSMEEDKVFRNLFDAYATEDKQYVIPVSFSIPILAGGENQVAQVSSLKDLLETVKHTQDLPPLGARNFLLYVFSTFWQDIQKEDGSVSRDELKNLLETVRNFNDLLQLEQADSWPFFQTADFEGENPCYALAFSFIDAWDILYENTAASLGYLGSVQDFTALSDHIPGQNLSYRLFPEHVFTSVIAGLNENSAQLDLAGEFLEFALSGEEQTIFTDGSLPLFPKFPVNRQAWDTMTAEPSEKELEDYKEIFQTLGGSFRWPSQAEFEKLEKEVSELDTPAMEDTVILSTILGSSKPYLLGEKSLDEAVNEIMQTLELYLAE